MWQRPARGQLQQVTAVGAVPEQPDNVASLGNGEIDGHAVHPVVRRTGKQRKGGADVDGPDGAVKDAASHDTCARQHEGCPRLHAAERAVLAEMATALGPVVGAGVHDGEVGGAPLGEQRVQPGGCERIRGVAEWVLIGHGIPSGQDDGGAVCCQRAVAQAVGDVDQPVPPPADEVDDVREIGPQQHSQRPLAQVPWRTAGQLWGEGPVRKRHAVSLRNAPVHDRTTTTAAKGGRPGAH